MILNFIIAFNLVKFIVGQLVKANYTLRGHFIIIHK